MYEHMTFEYILQRMLDRVPNDIDKREGSIIYDALAPAAAELAQMYAELDVQINLAFASTSSGEYVDLRVEEFGLTRKPATKAKRKGLFYDNQSNPFDVPIGSRFSISNLNYVVVEKLAIGEFALECETPGTVGNQNFGIMLPIEYVEGLSRAELEDVIVPGEDEETDAALIERFLAKVRSPGTSGNKADYVNWTLEVPGVGGVQVIPLWNGPGTVKVIIVDSEKQPASSELVSAVANHIEDVRPIGANVTVISAVAKAIDISATVVLAQGYTIQSVKDMFETAVREYFKDIALSSTYVSHAKIGTILLATPGVLDYDGLLLNGAAANVPLGDEETPVLGAITLGV